jgi:hypothetical protein
MADDQKEDVKVAAQVADSDAVKALLSVVDAIGDSMSVSDREKYEGLIALARAQSNA